MGFTFNLSFTLYIYDARMYAALLQIHKFSTRQLKYDNVYIHVSLVYLCGIIFGTMYLVRHRPVYISIIPMWRIVQIVWLKQHAAQNYQNRNENLILKLKNEHTPYLEKAREMQLWILERNVTSLYTGTTR